MVYVVAISIVVLLGLLISNKIRASLLFFGLVLIYYFLDYITLPTLTHGFVNSALLTLVLLLVVTMVFEKTSFLTLLSQKIFEPSYNKSLLKLAFLTSFLSAFLNNTAVVASMISVVNKNRYHSASKLLLPLSFAAIFGGTITLIGTSTNLLINSFMIENNLEALQLFDFVYVGVPIAIVGAFVLLFVSKFLPDKKVENQINEYFIEAKVLDKSKLIGKTLVENKLRHLEYLFLNELIRDGKLISPVSPDEKICAGDILLFSGDIQQIKLLEQFDGLKLQEKNEIDPKSLIEVIISHDSVLVNHTMKASNFRSKFNATVVAIKRGDQKLSGKMSEIKLQVGDNLVLSVGKDFHKRDNIKKNFYLINDELKVEEKLSMTQSVWAIGGFIAVLLLSLFKVMALVKGLLLLLVCFVLVGFISLSEIKRRFPYELMLIIGSALGIATVMIQSGLANILANVITQTLGSYGVFGAFLAVFLLTILLTEIITNNAAAALAFPIAYSTALAYDANILPFVMAVAYGASASFLLPYGYQTNLMVFSVGGYDIKTFFKSGLIVSIVYSVLVIALIPLVFPF